jgi:class 3 adenylate cyclase
VLAAFLSAMAALHFAVGVKEAMKAAPWSDNLLQQPLAEEVAILAPGTWVEGHKAPNEQPPVLFRGPRVKAGLDTGHAKAEVHATWRTIMYRGKVMNRASRVCGKAASDQVRVLCVCGSLRLT